MTENGRTPKQVFFTIRISPDLAVETVSPAIHAVLGVEAAAVRADPESVLDRLNPDDRRVLARLLNETPSEDDLSVDLSWRGNGQASVATRCAMRILTRDDGTVAVDGVAVDITDIRRDIGILKERLRLLAESCCDVVWTQSSDGAVEYITDAIERTRGMTRESALRQSITEMHTPPSATRLTAYVRQFLDALETGEPPPAFDGEQEYYRADGSIMFGDLTILPHLDGDGRFVEMLGIVRDVSARKAREAELDRLASMDPLTGLWNRRRGEEQLAQEIRNPRPGIPMALFLLDIDHFKMANDADGHNAGDLLLRDIAHLLRELAQENDTVIRWGGDEFMVLATGYTAEAAMRLAESIRVTCSERLLLGGAPVAVSIGIAALRTGDDASSWVARADSALYDAKRSGRNRAVIYDGD